MKVFALLPLMLSLSASAATAPWQDLASGMRVTLTQTLMLDEKGGRTIRVHSGGPYMIESITPLEGLSVVDFVLRPKTCPNPNLVGELTMVLPDGNVTTSKAEVGVYYNLGCQLEIMVEAKDFSRPSFFR